MSKPEPASSETLIFKIQINLNLILLELWSTRPQFQPSINHPKPRIKQFNISALVIWGEWGYRRSTGSTQGPSIPQSKVIFGRFCQLLAMNANKMATRTSNRLQERVWDSPTKGLLWSVRHTKILKLCHKLTVLLLHCFLLELFHYFRGQQVQDLSALGDVEWGAGDQHLQTLLHTE